MYVRSCYQIIKIVYINVYVYLAQRAKDSQKINKKTKTTKITEGWNSQKQLSGPVEKKRRKRRTLLYPHPNLSLGLVPYRPFTLK